jgi:hypothetical protein
MAASPSTCWSECRSRPPFTPEPQKRDGQSLVEKHIDGEAIARLAPSNSFDRCNYARSERIGASDRRVHEVFAGVRCWKEDQRAQAPCSRRHGRAWPRARTASGQHPGPRLRRHAAQSLTPIIPFIERVFADSGYAGEKVAKATLIAIEIVRKNPGQVGFAVNPRRYRVWKRLSLWLGVRLGFRHSSAYRSRVGLNFNADERALSRCLDRVSPIMTAHLSR